MSGLVEIEMSSFGAGSPTLVGKPATERGDAKVEHARRRSADGAAPGGRRRAQRGCRRAAGPRVPATLPSYAAELPGGGGRGGPGGGPSWPAPALDSPPARSGAQGSDGAGPRAYLPRLRAHAPG